MMIDAGVLQIVAVVAILGFLWTLHRDVSTFRKEVSKDIADLRERMATVESRMEAMDKRTARVEGLLEGFVGRQPEPQS